MRALGVLIVADGEKWCAARGKRLCTEAEWAALGTYPAETRRTARIKPIPAAHAAGARPRKA